MSVRGSFPSNRHLCCPCVACLDAARSCLRPLLPQCLLQALFVGDDLCTLICVDGELLLCPHVVTHSITLQITQLPQVYTPLIADRTDPIFPMALMHIEQSIHSKVVGQAIRPTTRKPSRRPCQKPSLRPHGAPKPDSVEAMPCAWFAP